MRVVARLLVSGLLWVSAAKAADTCGVRKGLYDGWLSVSKHGASNVPKGDALIAPGQTAPSPVTASGIASEYRAFFQCLSDAPAPGEEGLREFCKEAGVDRLAAVVCQTALYLKTGRANAKEFIDSLPVNRKGAEMIWDLDAITRTARDQGGKHPALFEPAGPTYRIVDELFVLVLDDRELAAAKYFHIAGAAPDNASQHTDAQIKVLLREAPSIVVKRWEVLRQYQPKLRKVLTDLNAELPQAGMKSLREGVAGFCSKDNLDCPEILKLFGRP